MWNIETYFLWFVFYSVVGWVYETLLCSFEAKQFVNRGFLNGPYCPIYGFGAVINALVLGRIDNPLMIFPAAVVLTTTLEYLTSLGMEKLFHARWWDYSDKKFNINGRVYLLGAIAFGSFSVIQLMWVQPWLVGIIEMIPNQFRSLSALILFSVLLVDTVYTVTKLSEFNRELQDVSGIFEEKLNSIRVLYEKANAGEFGKLHQFNSQILRMITSFPNLQSRKNNERLMELRKQLKERRDEIRRSRKSSDKKAA